MLPRPSNINECMQFSDDIYISEEDNRDHVLNDKSNWSVVNLDAPYSACSRCELHTEFNADLMATQLFVGSAHTYRRSCHLLTLMMSSSCNVYISLKQTTLSSSCMKLDGVALSRRLLMGARLSACLLL